VSFSLHLSRLALHNLKRMFILNQTQDVRQFKKLKLTLTSLE